MAAATYTHDLTDWIADSDTTAWGELTNAIAGGAPDEVDTESALQGTNTVSQSTNTTSLCSMCRILGASVTLSSGQVFLVWHGHGVATALLSYASGGLRLAVAGNALGDWKAWSVGGNDVSPFPYGKWVNNPVDPTVTADYTNGTPPSGGTSIFGVGSMCILSQAVAKGQPHVVDIIRYGRAEARFTGGDSGSGYATFAGFATLNDASSARWGLLQSTAGGYLWKGLMVLGDVVKTSSQRARSSNVATITTSTAHGLRVGDTVVISGLGGTGYNATAVITVVGSTTTFSYANTGTNEGTTADTGGSINAVVDFRDSNKTVFIQDTRKVSSTFNKIEISNASSRVDWTGISFTCLAPTTTASKGNFEMIDSADVNIDSCTFTDMNTFVFLSTGTVTTSTFRRTGQITTGGATFTNCTIDQSTASSAMLASSPANAALISGTSFVSDGTGHAIEITGTAANFTLTDNTYTGYAVSDGSTGNEAVYVNIASGSLNLTVSGGTTPSVRTAGCTVTVISGAVSATVNVKNEDGDNIQDARVFVKAATGGPFPFEASVTISNASTTATVSHTAHGMATNDKVFITGASHDANNGVFTITKINNDSYSYTMGSAPGSSPTGTITSTFVVLSGLTDVNGNITMSRVFPSDQPISGWARKATSAPFYKQSIISGSVDSVAGYSANLILISDQ